MAEKDKRSPAQRVPLRPFDSLFEPTIPQKQPETGINQLLLDDLHSFKDHPFRFYTEDKMAEIVENVQEHGVISPILVRPDINGGYEIVSGHNRVEACRRAGMSRIPANVCELDDDTAIINMVDSNLRRDMLGSRPIAGSDTTQNESFFILILLHMYYNYTIIAIHLHIRIYKILFLSIISIEVKINEKSSW